MTAPYHDATLDIPLTSIDWPLDGDPAISWSSPSGAADHIIVWHATVPNWAVASNISGSLSPGTTTYTDSVHAAIDGGDNYYWVVAYNAAETFAGNNNGVFGCQNLATASGQSIAGAGGNLPVQFPFTNQILDGNGSFTPPGRFRSTISSDTASFIPCEGPPTGVYDSGMPALVGALIHVTWNAGASFVMDIQFLAYDVSSGSGSGSATEGDGQTLPQNFHDFNHAPPYQFTSWLTTDGPGEQWGAGAGSPAFSNASGVSYTTKLSYVSPSAGVMTGGQGGAGGGSGSPPVPPPGPTMILAPPMPTSLPCIPCCNTCAPICECANCNQDH